MMTEQRVPLKKRLELGESPVGMLVRMPAEPLIEYAAVAGFDFVLLDCEHGPSDLLALQQHITLATARGMASLVRIGRSGTDDVLRVLESEAEGVLAPHIEDAAEAAAIVRAAHFPPLGGRGFAQYGQAGRFGTVPAAAQIRRARENTLVAVMIETGKGVADADAILAVPGVDAVMAGPADLSVSMGLTGGVDEPAVRDAVARINTVAAGAGRHVLTVVGDEERARAARPGLIVYNVTKVLVDRFRQLADGARDSSDGDT
ncbi:HpcH/HpaI aldolase/citrate lyase family protein [Streptomyces sp. NPDC096311]|uniref:HpcH/HpaI aldolase family protein n=1 Tax=Streptomyces sp. NPDC096311 TaxID=3366083 RepID=UPI0037FD8D08